MEKEIYDDTKLIPVPTKLVSELTRIANRKGSSISIYASEVFSQALRAEKLGADLKEAVDLWRMANIHMNAGNLNISSSSFEGLIEKLYKDHREDLARLWFDSGRWYGAFCLTKLNGEGIFSFLEKDLIISWNLDEVEIKDKDVKIWVRCISFNMSKELTWLLVEYLLGLFYELGYSESKRDILRGLVQLELIKNNG
jgi:hypothetical protein